MVPPLPDIFQIGMVVLLKPLLDNGPSPVASEILRPDTVPEGRDVDQISRKQRLDHEYWFIRKLAEVAPASGFVEISREALQEACIPRTSRGTHVKRWLSRLTSLITPKALAPVSKEQLCYGHVLIAFRLKEDDRICLRMLKASDCPFS
ncbi:unnamed protein product [Dibothriocephalus latus]|uniref:Uncharacterized protein n=1 Tax=Dibothriocephalus latus TaxID=60516 RepID=A0A3P7LFV6_DIBLA|nr:unnamed protein product [Dibothriocephalus latus]